MLGELVLFTFVLEAVASDPPPTADTKALDAEIDFSDWFDLIVRVSDVLPVECGDSETTVAQTLKQLGALGCLTWKNVQEDPALQKRCGLCDVISSFDISPCLDFLLLGRVVLPCGTAGLCQPMAAFHSMSFPFSKLGPCVSRFKVSPLLHIFAPAG